MQLQKDEPTGSNGLFSENQIRVGVEIRRILEKLS